MMKIATWNVNSVRARKERLLRVLERLAPDVLCLQELKVVDENFPIADIEAAGYRCVTHGQKTYNGVAILTRAPLEPEDVHRGMDDGEDDPQARFISARVADVRVISVYVPNGSTVPSDKFTYKLRWLERLGQYLAKHHRPDEMLALCGDFNVAPDDKDAAQPEMWADSVLCHPEIRAAYERLCSWGLRDPFRSFHPDGAVYSWWDYRMLAFPKNNGLRIDHVLTTAPLAERCEAAMVDRDERRGKEASDHCPVVLTFR